MYQCHPYITILSLKIFLSDFLTSDWKKIQKNSRFLSFADVEFITYSKILLKNAEGKVKVHVHIFNELHFIFEVSRMPAVA